ncbi:MAG: hypothetical protein Q8R18_03615 [bacterium]|nr:hypothetical protein [bacterium]
MKTKNLPIIAGVRNMSPLERELYLLEVNKPKSLVQKISDVYFEPQSFERRGRLYEALGVRYLKKVIMGTFGSFSRKIGANRDASNYFVGQNDRSVNALKKFEKGTRFNEVFHLFFGLYSGI